MKVTRHGQQAAIVLALLVAAMASGRQSGAAAAHGPLASPARMGGCAPETVRNSALGVTLTLPPGWQEAEPGHYAPWAVVLYVPAAAGQVENNLRLSIEPLGTTADSNDARAAAAAATRATRGLTLPITRRPFTVAGAPGVLLRGMPGAKPDLTIIVAHKHALYQIITFGGETFAADQRAALASLRFIPRVGPYPMTTPSANASAPRPPSLALTVRESGRLGGVSVEATGQGYHPNETLVLEGCWIGAAAPARRLVRPGPNGPGHPPRHAQCPGHLPRAPDALRCLDSAGDRPRREDRPAPGQGDAFLHGTGLRDILPEQPPRHRHWVLHGALGLCALIRPFAHDLVRVKSQRDHRASSCLHRVCQWGQDRGVLGMGQSLAPSGGASRSAAWWC